MGEREMLERAAKAAGYEACRPATFGMGVWMACRQGQWEPWNPLTDDGDALRLAVQLGIDLMLYGIVKGAFNQQAQYAEDGREDPFVATRLAITRAAAAIGEGKSHA